MAYQSPEHSALEVVKSAMVRQQKRTALALELVASATGHLGNEQEQVENEVALQNYVVGLINQNHQLWQALEGVSRLLGIDPDSVDPEVGWESEVIRHLRKLQLEHSLLSRVVGHKTLAAPGIDTGLTPDEEMEIVHLLP